MICFKRIMEHTRVMIYNMDTESRGEIKAKGEEAVMVRAKKS